MPQDEREGGPAPLTNVLEYRLKAFIRGDAIAMAMRYGTLNAVSRRRFGLGEHLADHSVRAQLVPRSVDNRCWLKN